MNGIVAARDAAGNVYYVDPATGATSWSIAALSGEHDIVGAQDARGRTYFVNLRTQATAWTRDELLDEKLPEGVVSTVDMSSGNVYYIHEASGRTAWHLDDVINEGGETFTSSKTPTTCEEVINEGADLSTPKTTTCDDVIHEGSEPSTSKTTTTACDDDAIEDGSKPSKSTNTMKTCVDVMDESSKLSIPKTTATCVVGKWPPDLPESCCFDNFEGRRLRYRGILLKKGHGDSLLGRRRWQHRWFVLNGAQLEYYGDAQFKTWKGRVKLRAESRVETGGGKKFKGRAKGLDASEANYFAITMTVDARTNAPIDGALQLRAKTNVEMDECVGSCSRRRE
ncbi:hypothetical protein CTAYLR_007118 [Chrysophaeum taylorii]|uniref:PH domain-containing protein n=1 Tax=Chrysophaeum taylorii TaxID=2483200 RepID=A0AAD7U7H9_9STRA|nr:hypothetical protein CTAYLR_007118 [Chrysophaeum taylorii]